ncbi:hypothetical protein [Parapedobacter tibetensis]|uniref:hypothetical protein n=1 Tax=Parapedobacter tibetensis TaxID=2972951 RepID=UPI00214DB99B|nr:hypothetical protein [Parapedobacter tibetensis]
MKRYVRITMAWMAVLLCMATCKQVDPQLGQLLDKSQINFEVVQDLVTDPGGNTVILINHTSGTVPVWDYGTGKSNRARDTVRYAFEGEYTIRFSAMTAGGMVEMDPVTITVTEDNLNYVNDPLWIALSDGPGEEKQWLLDTESKYFAGPLSFYGVNNGWLLEGGAWDGGGATGCYGDDCWTWSPEGVYAMDEGDYGVMTFSLKGGPFFHAIKPMEGGIEQNGTYYLDINSKMLTINGASILRGYKPESNGLTGISNWTNYRVLALDEDILRLGVIRDRDVDGEGLAMLVYNFISKEYADNWVPEEDNTPDEGFDPSFESGQLLNLLTGGPSSGKLWRLDGEGNPVDWIAKGKGWTENAGSSHDWGWNDGWAAIAENSWIRFDRYGGQNYTRSQNGTITNGTFTINEETNEITLSGNTLIQNPDSWMSPTQHTIKVVKAFPDEPGRGMWFGTAYDTGKDEWLAFHYIIPQD